MKTRLVAFSLLAMILLAGTAQTSGQGFSIGAKAGVGFSYLSNFKDYEDMLKRSPNIMADGGLTGNAAFTSLVSLQFELLYEQKGEKLQTTYQGITTKVSLLINYITLPILVEFGHSFGNVKIFGGIGPYIGYAINGKVVAPGSNDKIEFGKDNYRRFDAGGSADLGAGIKAGPGHIFLDLRYNYGLMDIQQMTNKPDGYKSLCNRNFVVSLGYLLPLGKK